ncbi:MAG: translational machinery protein [Telluria sp.]
MQFNHVVVWIDHAEAHLIGFNRDESESSVVKSGLDTHHVHKKTGRSDTETAHYFEHVVGAVRNAVEVLVVGPGLEKLRLLKHILKYHPQQSDKFVGVETVDHPSDAQLLAFARNYFRRVDNLR